MGATASFRRCTSRDEEEATAHEEQNLKFELRDSRDILAKEMYTSSPKIDALQHVISNEAGREAFMIFLRSEFADENLKFYIAIDRLRKATDSADIICQASAIVSTYLQPGQPSEVCLSGSLKKSIVTMATSKKAHGNPNMMAVLIEAQHETVRIMALGAFPRFVQSAGFINYRTLNHISDPAIQARMSAELNALLAKTSWLRHFITSVENLPVCVSLAAANKELPGFPLMYVNAAFENTTGYPREEIIGKNCRFLQMGRIAEHKSEDEAISLMSKALREGKQVKVAITNFKKDGSPFRNVLALKPIFDKNGEYSFVVSIQINVGGKHASPKKMKIIDDLFKILPSTMNSFLTDGCGVHS